MLSSNAKRAPAHFLADATSSLACSKTSMFFMCCLICLLRVLLIHNTPRFRTRSRHELEDRRKEKLVIHRHLDHCPHHLHHHQACHHAQRVACAGWYSGNRPSRCAGAWRSPRRPLPVRGCRVFGLGFRVRAAKFRLFGSRIKLGSTAANWQGSSFSRSTSRDEG